MVNPLADELATARRTKPCALVIFGATGDLTRRKLVPALCGLALDGLLRRMSELFPLWAALGFLIPAAIAGVVTKSWTGALLGFLWGGLVRVFFVHHITWSINSVCHLWGYRSFRSHDESRNNVVFGVIGLGEGWHNNHHAFPTSARHGLRWWEFDASYLIIRGMELVGLAWKVKVPSAAAMNAKLR